MGRLGQLTTFHKYSFFFVDTKCGDGIEAWLTLKDEDMAKFECDDEILGYLSIT